MKNTLMRKALIIIFLLPFISQAQNGIHLSNLSDHNWSQRYNPATIADLEFEKFSYGAQGGFWFGNNQVNLDGVFAENGYITEATKDRIISQMKSGEVIGAGYMLELANVNLKAGGLTLGISLDDRLQATFGLNNANTFGLLMKGNAPYAGDTISDSGIFGKLYHTRELGIATAIDKDQLKFGVRLKLIQGSGMLDLDHLDYTMITEEDATNIHLIADYELFASNPINGGSIFGFRGYGAAIDAGLTYQLNDNMSINASVNDLGATFWKANHLDESLDIDWSGIYIASIFQDSVSAIVEEEVDSLKGLIFPDTLTANHTLLAPTSIRVGGTYNLSEKNRVAANLVYFPIKTGAYSKLPLLSVAYYHEVISGLTLGANAYGGGQDTYGFGLMGNYRFTAGSMTFDVMVGGDNLIGMMLPSSGRGFSLYGGIGVGM